MVQLILLLQFFFYGFGTIIFNCNGQLNFNSSPTKKFRDLLVLRSKFVDDGTVSANTSGHSKFQQMSATSKQWLNVKVYSSENCPISKLEAYGSISFGYCVQNGTSSYINSATALSNGNINATESVYTNDQCSGPPSKVVATTLKQSCSNDGNSSSEYYSITNSIPPLPAGLLVSDYSTESDCTSGSPSSVFLLPLKTCYFSQNSSQYYEYNTCDSKGYNYTTYEDASCSSPPLYSIYIPFNDTCSMTESSDSETPYRSISCHAADPTAAPTTTPKSSSSSGSGSSSSDSFPVYAIVLVVVVPILVLIFIAATYFCNKKEDFAPVPAKNIEP